MPNITFKGGKKPARVDNRTLKFSTVVKKEFQMAGAPPPPPTPPPPPLPPTPTTFDVDSQYPGLVDTRIFKNDTVGDCVAAEQAHHEFRFQFEQQGKQITILDNEVLAYYYAQTGGGDTGLDWLSSLNVLRQQGFPIGGKIYKIHAFASVDWTNHQEVMTAIHLFNGVAFGMQVSQSAVDQFNNNQPWTVVANDGGNQGGHAVYALRFLRLTIQNINEIGPVICTWGGYVQATWEFWDKYVDECYILIDERDSWVPSANDPLDVALLEAYLAEIGGTPSQQITINTLSLPTGYRGRPYSVTFSADGGTPPYTWSLQNNSSLPGGLSFSSNGVLSGIPINTFSQNITFMVNDSIGNASGVILTLTIKKKKCIFGGN